MGSRAKYPMKRNASGGWQNITWDEATTLLAQKIIEAVNTASPDSVASYNTGKLPEAASPAHDVARNNLSRKSICDRLKTGCISQVLNDETHFIEARTTRRFALRLRSPVDVVNQLIFVELRRAERAGCQLSDVGFSERRAVSRSNPVRHRSSVFCMSQFSDDVDDQPGMFVPVFGLQTQHRRQKIGLPSGSFKGLNVRLHLLRKRGGVILQDRRDRYHTRR